MQQSQKNFSPPLMQQQQAQMNWSLPVMQQTNLSPPLVISNGSMQQVPGGFVPSVSPSCFVNSMPMQLNLLSYNSVPMMTPPNSVPMMTPPLINVPNSTPPTMQSMVPMWTPYLSPFLLSSERTPSLSRSLSAGSLSAGSESAFPQTWHSAEPQVRSRRGSLCSNPAAEGMIYAQGATMFAMDTLPTVTPDHTPSASPNRGQKQELITSVRQQCHELLFEHFPYLKEGNIMSVHSEHEMKELDELKDVLRGSHVGNIRAKSISSLSVLVDFLKCILANPSISVKRVDVILQKKKTNHLKGLLVNVEFGSQNELVYVRDTIWEPLFKDELPKFMPALFAQDCSWFGQRPSDLKYMMDAQGDIRVQGPLPEKLKALDLKEGCRIKSMTVIFKHGKKNKPHEVAPREFLNVLQGRRFKTKNGMRTLSDKTDVTISFEEDWKTNFWRLPA